MADRRLVAIVGHNIKLLRETHGLSQEALGAAAGTSRQTIFRIETGVHPTNIDLLEAIAKQLGTIPAALMTDSPAWQRILKDFPDLDQSQERLVRHALEKNMSMIDVELIEQDRSAKLQKSKRKS